MTAHSVRAIRARLIEAERRYAQAQGRAAAGDRDDSEQAREALQEIDAARAELQRLGGAGLRQFEP
jgi:hypothetical protein